MMNKTKQLQFDERTTRYACSSVSRLWTKVHQIWGNVGKNLFSIYL